MPLALDTFLRIQPSFPWVHWTCLELAWFTTTPGTSFNLPSQESPPDSDLPFHPQGVLHFSLSPMSHCIGSVSQPGKVFWRKWHLRTIINYPSDVGSRDEWSRFPKTGNSTHSCRPSGEKEQNTNNSAWLEIGQQPDGKGTQDEANKESNRLSAL